MDEARPPRIDPKRIRRERRGVDPKPKAVKSTGHLVLTPAYDRDYKSAAEVREAWESGKDFEVASIYHMGQKINKEDAERFGLPEGSYIRYKRLTELETIHEEV
jgi:hypothetical protein